MRRRQKWRSWVSYVGDFFFSCWWWDPAAPLLLMFHGQTQWEYSPSKRWVCREKTSSAIWYSSCAWLLFTLPFSADYIRTFTWDKRLEMVVKSTGILGGQGKSSSVLHIQWTRLPMIPFLSIYLWNLGTQTPCWKYIIEPDKCNIVKTDISTLYGVMTISLIHLVMKVMIGVLNQTFWAILLHSKLFYQGRHLWIWWR